jgi:hypothetical protein
VLFVDDEQRVLDGLRRTVRTKARRTGAVEPGGRARFEVSEQLRERLAYRRGNVAVATRVWAAVGGDSARSRIDSSDAVHGVCAGAFAHEIKQRAGSSAAGAADRPVR